MTRQPALLMLLRLVLVQPVLSFYLSFNCCFCQDNSLNPRDAGCICKTILSPFNYVTL